MSTTSDDDLKRLLRRMRAGDADAEQELVALLYLDLRAIAARRMRKERPEHTWQPTLLVDEAFMRLRGDGTLASAPDGKFLLMAASKAMHRLLVDHHRQRSCEKRGGQQRRQSLDIAMP
jgi:RNA polymerase sigma factor (TIGR02999 family)